MVNLSYYFNDGANPQAKATLAYLQWLVGDGLDASYNPDKKRYEALPMVARWENCREQGYVVSLRNGDRHEQLNIAFFEHRNGDSIHALVWEQKSINSITLDIAAFPPCLYRTKWETSFSVVFGEAYKMASYISETMNLFWKYGYESTEFKSWINHNDQR